MSAFKAKTFSGIAPKVAPRLLADVQAQIAANCKLFSGELRSWKRPYKVATPSKAGAGTVKSIFRMTDSAGAEYWLNWLTDVNCVRGPVAGDTSKRICWTGDYEPRISNLALATGGADKPYSFYVLGVYMPVTKPTVAPSGGTGAATTRAYVYTFVTPWGEEGAPSPASTVTTGKVDDTWALSGMETAPPNNGTITAATHASGVVTLTADTTRGLRAGERVTHAAVAGMTDLNGTLTVASVVDTTHYTVSLTTAQTYTSGGTWARVAPHNTTGMTKRIYRVLSGTTGADYQFAAEIPAANTTYNDTIADSALGEVLQSKNWYMPPTDMAGLIELPNGVLAAFSKNELCFSEPYRPHAWPSGYRLTTNRDIVGIGAYGSTVAVGTKGQPYVVTGTHPDSMSMERIDLDEPCLSKRGATNMPFGVLYPSPNGMVLIGVGGAVVATAAVLTKGEWASYYPSTLIAREHQGWCFAFYDNGNGDGGGFIFDRSGLGPSLVPTSYFVSAAYTDAETGDLYIVHSGDIKKWDADPNNNMPFDWKSKVYVAPKPINPGASQVFADYAALTDLAAQSAQQTADTAANAAILAGSETWPGQSVTRGELGESMLGEVVFAGSLLKGGYAPNYDTRYLQFQLYADNALKFTKQLTNNDPFRLPSGYTATDFELRLSGNIDVHSVEVAETVSELGAV